MTKNYFIRLLLGAALIAFLGIIFNSYAGARERALVAEVRVHVLEEERMGLELEFEQAVESYELLKTNLGQAHDSIAEIREDAENRATESSVSFEENVLILRDSLEAYDGLGAILDTLRATHLREVSAYQDQVATLEADKALLWKRVEATDSMWVREQEINDALRREVAALNEASDAWREVGSPGLFQRVTGAAPYIALGMLGGFFIAQGN
jgi:chromosome segregation ATPase